MQIVKSQNKVCDAGYYCKSKAIKPHPTDETGGMCEAGYYCPKKSE